MKICYTEFYPNRTDRAKLTRHQSPTPHEAKHASHYAEFQGPRAYELNFCEHFLYTILSKSEEMYGK